MKPKKIKKSKPIRRMPSMTEIMRFMRYIKLGRSPKRKGIKGKCWLWVGYLDKDGYGQFFYDGRAHWANRISYQFFMGDVEKGMEVHHECLNAACVNPAHLSVKTKEWNSSYNNHKEPLPF